MEYYANFDFVPILVSEDVTLYDNNYYPLYETNQILPDSTKILL